MLALEAWILNPSFGYGKHHSLYNGRRLQAGSVRIVAVKIAVHQSYSTIKNYFSQARYRQMSGIGCSRYDPSANAVVNSAGTDDCSPRERTKSAKPIDDT